MKEMKQATRKTVADIMTTTLPIMTTDRLVLRSVNQNTCQEDFEVLYKVVFSDQQVMKQAFYEQPMSRKEALDFFHKNFDFTGSGMQLGVLCLRDNSDQVVVIGFSGLLACDVFAREDDYEIGFVLGRSHWGKGYATEIGKAQVQFGLEKAGCTRLLGVVRHDNVASKRALEKSGLSFCTTLETKDRGVRDIYCISKEEYETRL